MIRVGLAGFLSVGSPLVPALARGEKVPIIVINTGRYNPYYHIHFELTAAVLDFAASDRQVRSGGQFEVRVRPEHFPVPAPHCRSTLILRMPWTSPHVPEATEKIAAKQALLMRIWGLAQTLHAVVSVVLELNPYVEVISRTPLRLQLTQCNVFFRHAFGGYIDNTRPLQSH